MPLTKMMLKQIYRASDTLSDIGILKQQPVDDYSFSNNINLWVEEDENIADFSPHNEDRPI